MPAPFNPYAGASQVVEDVDSPGDLIAQAEALRRDHLTYEANLKIMGGLCYLCGVGALWMLVQRVSFANSELGIEFSGAMSSVWLSIVAPPVIAMMIFFALGRGLLTLKPWVRLPGFLICLAGLFIFPVGTVVCAYVLYLFYSDKDCFILSREYAAIVAATPEVKYPRRLWVWRTLGTLVPLLLVALALLAIFWFVAAPPATRG